MSKTATILVVDDELGVRESFNMVLKDRYDVVLAESGNKALDIVAKRLVDLVLLDILLPDIDGLDVLEKIKGMDAAMDVIMVTAVKDVQTAVKAIKMGAYEYIIKPFVVDDLLALIQRVLEKRLLARKVFCLEEELNRYRSFEKMIGLDESMQAVYGMIDTIADGDGTVLIQGESGTGKELVARAIHNRSERSQQPFVVISCAAIPADLMEGELFGHERGAFTGATVSRAGKLEIANRGTVFLDDIDCLDINLQAKLLRVIQEKEFERLGSTRVIKVDIRFIAASNKNLKNLTAGGKFREDLYYRLNVFPISIPPLRERKGDVSLLLKHFLDLNSKKTGKPQKILSQNAMKVLMRYDWPGNVRELKNLMERLFTVTKDRVIHLKDIPDYALPKTEIKGMLLKDAVNAFEKQYIAEVLKNVNGSKKMAAEVLGIHRNTLALKLKELGLAAGLKTNG